MADYETAVIRPGTENSFNIIKKVFSGGKINYEWLDIDDYRFYDISIKVEKGLTLKVLSQISMFYPNVKVEVDIEYESEDYKKRYKYCVINNNYKLIDTSNTNYRNAYFNPDNPFEISEEEEKELEEIIDIMDDLFSK